MGGVVKPFVNAYTTMIDPFKINPVTQAAKDTINGDNGDSGGGIDSSGRPIAPSYGGVTDNTTGLLKDQYKLSNGDAYSKIAQDRLATDTASARNNTAGAAAGAEANARTSLASRGGLQGGVAARLAMQGQKNAQAGQQDVTATQTRGQQDITSKQFDLGREAEKANLGTSLADQNARNQFNQARYGTQMQEWAAGQAGQAQLAGNKTKGQQGGLAGMPGKILGK